MAVAADVRGEVSKKKKKKQWKKSRQTQMLTLYLNVEVLSKNPEK